MRVSFNQFTVSRGWWLQINLDATAYCNDAELKLTTWGTFELGVIDSRLVILDSEDSETIIISYSSSDWDGADVELPFSRRLYRSDSDLI
jgi:hypothetical protein